MYIFSTLNYKLDSETESKHVDNANSSPWGFLDKNLMVGYKHGSMIIIEIGNIQASDLYL